MSVKAKQTKLSDVHSVSKRGKGNLASFAFGTVQLWISNVSFRDHAVFRPKPRRL